MNKRISAGLVVAAFVAVAAPAAVQASSPLQAQYGNPLEQPTQPTGTGSAGTTVQQPTGTTTTPSGEVVAPAQTTETPSVKEPKQAPTGTGPAGAPAGTSGPELPFTGLEIGLIVALGGAAAGAGVVLRRATRGNRS